MLYLEVVYMKWIHYFAKYFRIYWYSHDISCVSRLCGAIFDYVKSISRFKVKYLILINQCMRINANQTLIIAFFRLLIDLAGIVFKIHNHLAIFTIRNHNSFCEFVEGIFQNPGIFPKNLRTKISVRIQTIRHRSLCQNVSTERIYSLLILQCSVFLF